jgi:hypothetical protein
MIEISRAGITVRGEEPVPEISVVAGVRGRIVMNRANERAISVVLD